MKVAACHSCETSGEVEAIRRACAACQHKCRTADDAATRCPTAAQIVVTREKCASCKRASQDDIRIKKAPHNVRPDLTADTASPTKSEAMPLTDKAERAKWLIYEFSSLSPVETIVLLHLARHGTARTAARAVRQFAERVRRYAHDRHATGDRFTKNAERKKYALGRAMIAAKIKAELYPAYPALRRLRRK